MGANLQRHHRPQTRRRRWTSRMMSGSRSRASILSSGQVSSDDWHLQLQVMQQGAAVRFSYCHLLGLYMLD
uniref:Uncharacterized protein n=1 Tax=Setaria italica TaxID=4555 RepID=K3YKM4_SETIT